MASSSPAHAVELYRAAVARAVSCLTRAHIDVGSGYAREDVSHALLMAAGDPVALRGDHPLTLSIGEHYRIAQTPDGGWQARTTAYFYAIGQQRIGELHEGGLHDAFERVDVPPGRLLEHRARRTDRPHAGGHPERRRRQHLDAQKYRRNERRPLRETCSVRRPIEDLQRGGHVVLRGRQRRLDLVDTDVWALGSATNSA